MSKTMQIEVWEFERKSVIHWRAPFLPDDPPHFLSRDKQRLNNLHEYKLETQYIFDKTQKWQTDENGWIYSDHFQSKKWSKNQFSSSHLCRKRCWKRVAKKQFVSKITKVHSAASLNHINEEKELDFKYDENNHSNRNSNMYEYIIHQIEINQSSKWKTYQNGWYDQKMKALKTIQTPYDIKLSNLDHNNHRQGTWKWSENWCCVDADSSSNPNTDNTLYNNDIVRLHSLKYMSCTTPPTLSTSTSTSGSTPISMRQNTSNSDDYYHNTTPSRTPEINGIAPDYSPQPLQKKKKKKRIRIKKNAKKLFRKMKGNKKAQNSKININSCTPHGDLLQIKIDKTVCLLSQNEENELHELFNTNIDRGWSYANKCSKDDTDWNPENKIIIKCNYRRRTWVRCAIFDISPYYNHTANAHEKAVENENEFEEKMAPPLLTKSESLTESIARTKSKANDLIAMIDDVLSGENTLGILNEDKNANNTHSMMEDKDKHLMDIKEDNIAIGSYIMSETLNALLWHIHLCSLYNVVDQLPPDKKKKDKLYFIDNIRLRSRKINDFMSCLMRLQFEYICITDEDRCDCEERYIINNIDITSDDGIIEICKIIYNDLLSDVLYQCSFHQTKEMYTNQQRTQLMNKINDIIILYSMLKKTNCLSAMTELILLMSASIKFIEQSKDENKDDIYEEEDNPLWILDDLLNIGQQFVNVSAFELSCLFFPDMLTNLKHFLFILSKLNINDLSRRERKLCTNATQHILATLESYFQKLHDNVRPKTVVQLLQIFISLTDMFETMIRKSTKTTFKQIRAFLSEYHKLSIEKAYKCLSDQNKITLSMFTTTDMHQLQGIVNDIMDISNTRDKSVSVVSVTSPTTKQNERDIQQISFKLAAEYSYSDKENQLQTLSSEEIEKKHQKVLNKHFSNNEVQQEWWEYIEDILHLIDTDYSISIALWKGKIFQNIPVIGIRHLAHECGKEFAGSFMNNPHSLDISYKLLLCGAHKIQDRLEAICYKIANINKQNMHLNVGEIFSFVQYEIFERLSYWMDLSMNRVAIWIKRAAGKETWIPPQEQEMAKNRLLMTFKVHNTAPVPLDEADTESDIDDTQVTWGTFITDSFSFINNELDAFFDHLISFPSEGMSMATVFFERLQFLVETIIHLTEMSMRDCTVLDNKLEKEEKEKPAAAHKHIERKRKETRVNVRDGVHRMEMVVDSDGVLDKAKRKQMIDAFNKEYVHQMNESIVRGQDILNKFKETLNNNKLNNDRLHGLKCIADIITNAQQIDNESRTLSGLPSLQRIEDEQFYDELKYICVKFSSLSRSMQIINDLSGYLLNKIQCIPAPSEQRLRKKFEIHKQELIKSAYKFITNCKKEAKSCMERAVNRMVFQLLSVQNGAYFKLKLYIYGRIPSTTAIKIGLFQRIANYLNVCSDYLREKDLQTLVRDIAVRFCRHMKEILVGYSMKPPRVFRKEHDTKYIVQDFEECKKLFCDFGLREMNIYFKANEHKTEEKKEEKVTDLDEYEVDVEHPFYPYFECIENMKRPTLILMQKHMILMAKRNEEQKNKRYEEKFANKNKKIVRNNKYKQTKSLAKVAKHQSIRAKAIMDRAKIKKIYDSILLHVLTHRSEDEEALSYCENFIQYRDRSKPLIIDLSNIGDTLRIIIHEGKELPALDFTGKSDPYCKVKIMPFKLFKETRVVRQTLNPKWDQPFDFNLNVKSKHKDQRLNTQHIIIEFDCWDWDTIGSDDHIGKHTERIEYGQENIHEKWVKLYAHSYNDDDRVQGELLITIECENLWNQ